MIKVFFLVHLRLLSWRIHPIDPTLPWDFRFVTSACIAPLSSAECTPTVRGDFNAWNSVATAESAWWVEGVSLLDDINGGFSVTCVIALLDVEFLAVFGKLDGGGRY